MRFLVLYAHPVHDSFAAALHGRVVAGLTAAGHFVDDCDLYAEGFDPVLSETERRAYHDLGADRSAVAAHIDRFERAEGLAVISPVWNLGLPAILKGYMDRVFLPGVTFTMRDGALERRRWLKRVACVHTYGMERWRAFLIGDPPRRAGARLPGGLLAPGGRYRFLALYGMNKADDARRAGFLDHVERAMERL